MTHHLALRIPLNKSLLAAFAPSWLLDVICYRGYEAVFVFFVISGFLITSNALRRWGSLARIDLREFYVRRFARIMPCLVLLIGVLAALHLARVQDYVIKGPGQSLSGTVLAALGFYLNWYEGQTGWLPGNWDVLWSLSIEEVFYFFFPLVCLVTRRTRVLAPLLIVLALSLPLTRAAAAGNPIWQEKAYLPAMAAIAAGVLAALVKARWTPQGGPARYALYAAGVVGFCAAFPCEDAAWRLLGQSLMLPLTIGIACLLVAFDRGPRSDSAHAGSPASWLGAAGRRSYEIYLTHMFVVYSAVRLFKSAGGDLRYGFWWYLPVLAVCALLGWLVDRLISAPSNRALRGILIDTRSPGRKEPARVESG